MSKLKEDKVPGGLAAGMTLNDIAEKHGISVDLLVAEFKKGISVEMEHTTDREVAKEIALDHLFEDPKYYTKLIDMEKNPQTEGALFEFMMPRDVDSKMKELGISKIPISSQGEKILKGMVKEKFLDNVTNKDRLIYFVESLGKEKFGYGSKGKPLSPLVDRFWNDITTEAIFFGGKMAAYSVAMNIKDMKRNGEEMDSPYEMLKEYFKNFGMDYNRSRVFDSATRNLEEWMKRNKIQESINEGFKSEYKGNDGIIWKKGKTQGGVTNFTPYYKGHNIDFGGHNFKTEKELKDFIKDYILSNQLYNKYKFESVNENLITEKQFKGLEGISANTPLTKITNDQKLKIIKSTGNIIDFIVPKGVNRNFWQVIGTGKIKKNLSGEHYLEGKVINSPMFKSIDDLIKGVDWESMENKRRFNESIEEAKKGEFEMGDFVHFKSANKTGMVKKISGDKVTIMTMKGDFTGDIKDIKVLYQDNVNEGNFGEIDIMAREARNFNEFVKEFYKDFRDFPKDKDTLKWLKSLYDGRSKDESVNEVGQGDWHFKAIKQLWDKSSTFTKKKIAALITKNPNSIWDKIAKELGASDYDDVSYYTDMLHLESKDGLERVAQGLPQTEEEPINEWKAEEVLQQLGGRRFMAMTGAKNFVKNDPKKQITFKIGGGAKGGINYVRITLTSMDLYNIEFLKARGTDLKVVASEKGVYNDQLQQMFTKHTGMHTRL